MEPWVVHGQRGDCLIIPVREAAQAQGTWSECKGCSVKDDHRSREFLCGIVEDEVKHMKWTDDGELGLVVYWNWFELFHESLLCLSFHLQEISYDESVRTTEICKWYKLGHLHTPKHTHRTKCC